MVSKVFLFPLPNTMSLNKVVMPYHIFGPGYRTMVNDAVTNQSPIAVVPFRPDGNYSSHACYAGIPQILHRYEDGRMDISLSGEVRCRLKNCINEAPYLIFSCQEEPEFLKLSSRSQFALECILDAMMAWANKSLPHPEQRAAFKTILGDNEALLNYATLFLINENSVRMAIVEESVGDMRAEMILKALGPKEVSLGPFLPPIKWK